MKKILVAVDGSKYSKKSFESALEEAKELGDKITILKVVPSYGQAGEVLEDALKEEINSAKELTKELKEEAEDEGVKAESEVITETSAVNGIVKYAEKNDFDLIIVGSRGKTELETIHLGSVSEGVVKRAHKPVLVYR